MKATGIVRRIDDLGRVVIPKEIRRTMRIKEGDPLEIYTNSEGEVIFKKYSPIGEISTFAGQYTDVLYKMCGLPAIVCDRDHVVAAAGIPKKEILERRITSTLEDALESRKTLLYTDLETPKIKAVEGIDRYALIACPVVAGGDNAGGILLLSDGEDVFVSETQMKLVQAAAAFLMKQLES